MHEEYVLQFLKEGGGRGGPLVIPQEAFAKLVDYQDILVRLFSLPHLF
jgi:hypothetical protein